MFPAHFNLAEILVLIGGVIPPAPAVPASNMISARMNRVGEHSSPVMCTHTPQYHHHVICAAHVRRYGMNQVNHVTIPPPRVRTASLPRVRLIGELAHVCASSVNYLANTTRELCPRTRFSLAEVLVLDGTTGPCAVCFVGFGCACCAVHSQRCSCSLSALSTCTHV